MTVLSDQSRVGSKGVAFGARLRQLAAEAPDRPVIIFAPHGQDHVESMSVGELERASNRAARLLADRAVGSDSTVVMALPNSPDHYVATYAAWKVGALVLPLSASLPAAERDTILEVAQPTLVVSEWSDLALPGLKREDLHARSMSDDPLPDVVASPSKAIASGGSTGRPKVIVDPQPWVYTGEIHPLMEKCGVGLGQIQLVPGPLHHNSPFSWSHWGIVLGHSLVLMDRFDAARAVDLIKEHRVQCAVLVPTMMKRILEVPGISRERLHSLEAVIHTAAPCPPSVKRAFIELIGAEKVHEGFGATESVGIVYIRGDEWLAHEGSVGRPLLSELKILDEGLREVPRGVVGEIFMRGNDRAPTYEYRGSSPLKTTEDGFASVGDLGWVDDEGYLFLADRRADMIIVGGANVYPAEVEAALLEHPQVADAAVIGVEDVDLGKRVHAVVTAKMAWAPPTAEVLEAHCRERLAPYKVPRSFDVVDHLPRNEFGKIRRSALKGSGA
jgi:bile acid-coenzyme A ligase